jgi:hypothetical protein
VTATKSWGPTLTESVGREVDYQVAAPTETRTPNWHRAKIAHQRVRMEGWRQGRLGSKEDHSTTKGNYKTDLTLTGLLMEGLGQKFCDKHSEAECESVLEHKTRKIEARPGQINIGKPDGL